MDIRQNRVLSKRLPLAPRYRFSLPTLVTCSGLGGHQAGPTGALQAGLWTQVSQLSFYEACLGSSLTCVPLTYLVFHPAP